MKYPSNTTADRFCEQFDTVVSLFDQWNDCERTVVLCALLKRIPYSNLKFLQLSIEHNSSQAYNAQSKLQVLESNSNNALFLSKLINRYKNFHQSVSNVVGKEIMGIQYLESFEKKEDILHDILTYLPLLKPGNNEIKSLYMELIPIIVEDSITQTVSIELAQHVFSYLLIHPAITNDDRRSLSHWLRHLQDHISQSFSSSCQSNITCSLFLPQVNTPVPPADLKSPYLTSSTSSLSSSSWQTVAPPLENTNWDLHNIQVTQEFCDELSKSLSGSGNLDTGTVQKPKLKSSSQATKLYQMNENDDHDVSFSKNGTEILDFDFDDCKSLSAVANDSKSEYLKVPIGDMETAVKTRRSNSLTTTSTASASNFKDKTNLALQKPRSFSLSLENTHGKLTSAGSETRLDEINKPYVRYNGHNIGMSNIGQWLKSLRLHKYVWLFSNLSYEQMLDISEEYLENLGVTKGARHKLVICIQKLRDRKSTLQQMEQELMAGVRQINSVLEELANIVLTPMKPVDVYSEDDVAGQFFKVLDYIASRLVLHQSQMRVQSQDEDPFNVTLWIIERTLHSEAFVALTNQLKEHKYKLYKIKSQFAPKNHYNKSSLANNGNKRWQNNMKHKFGSSEGLKMHRKGSNPLQQNYNLSTQLYYPQNKTNSNNCYNKSSSYPNFNNGGNSSVMEKKCMISNSISAVNNGFGNNNGASISQKQLEEAANALSLAYHHHSLNNLLIKKSLPQAPGVNNILSQQSESMNGMMQSCGNEFEVVKVSCGEKEGSTKTAKNNEKLNNSIGDINSRLEFLCLQMTEQAIN